MRTLHGDGLGKLLLASLVKELDLKGMLHVLRHGFEFYGKIFRLATFKPAHGLNDEVLAFYQQNRLTVTRHVLCHPGTVRDPETGAEYTEPGMNTDVVTGKSIGEAALPERFASSWLSGKAVPRDEGGRPR